MLGPPMRTLLLLRHAKSSWDDSALSDHARPLNARGRLAAAAMAQEMRRIGLAPEHVMVSSARRTLQTLAALDPWDAPPRIFPLDSLYLAPAADLLDAVNAVPPGVRCVLLVGHNPGLHEFALQLAGDASALGDERLQRLAGGYPSGALSEFAVAAPWQELRPGGGRLTRYLLPSDLSEVSA